MVAMTSETHALKGWDSGFVQSLTSRVRPWRSTSFTSRRHSRPAFRTRAPVDSVGVVRELRECYSPGSPEDS
ncbi:hypothetical protein QFZ22_005142 [Streptomyces canus]|uniref:Uncharacterized protein n=1 Tax=Streptomyces canus TaxID=58343 RepID=A0AAW8FJC2_9ACTN|nr:hypothetical protein [Streptomyces canus]